MSSGWFSPSSSLSCPASCLCMEQVEDDLGVCAIDPNLQFIGGRHVDCHGAHLLGNTGRQLPEEGRSGVTGAAVADSQLLAIYRIDDNGGVAMALVQCELVHRQIVDLAPSGS